MIDLSGKKVGIIGFSLTGEAVLEFLKKKGAEIYVTEIKNSDQLADKLSFYGVKYELGRNSSQFLKECELVVVSPGVPNNSQIIKELEELGIKIIPEIELASYFVDNEKIIGITGSNGKSTVTSLIAHIINVSQKKAISCGNIGSPFIKYVDGDYDYFVVELSSFQLETIDRFHPKISVLLNITPDHIDRHGSFKNYASSKFKIFKNQTPDDFAVLNSQDEYTRKNLSKIKSKKIFFSVSKKEDAYYEKGKLFYREEFIISSSELRIKGIHNVENALSSIAVSKILGISNDYIREGLKTFEPLPHRTEFVAEINGIKFVNDSKATNVDSAYKAISSIGKNLIVILGGKDKGSDFSPLKAPIEKNAKAVILIGEASEKISSQIGNKVKKVFVSSMMEAVEKGFELGDSGDTIILTPACASFDMYSNYMERGEDFKNCVYSLKEKVEEGKSV